MLALRRDRDERERTVPAVAGVFGTIFVALTVLYLAIQIKNGVKATHSQRYSPATSTLAEMATIIGSGKERQDLSDWVGGPRCSK